MQLAVLTSQYPAASHTFIRREIAELRRRGVSVDVFSIRESSFGAAAVDDADARETWYVLPVGPGRLAAAHLWALARGPRAWCRAFGAALTQRRPGLRGLLWSCFYFAEAMVLAREFDRRGIDHLHNHFADGAATAGMVAAGFLGIDWSLTLHGAADFGPEWGPLLPGKLEAARFAVCVSHFGRAQALRALPVRQWDKVVVSRCGVEIDRLPARSAAVDAEPPVVVCVGRLSPEKGIPGLLEAWAALPESIRDKARLRLVGDGPDRESVAASVKARGWQGRVELLGALPEAEALREIAGAQILVLPSLMEGLPVVLMEAMALGVPVVAPHLAGIPELVTSGEHGWLFAPADWNALARSLALLLADPGARATMGAAARARVQDEFSMGPAVDPLAARLLEKDAAAAVAEASGEVAER
ncbi:MAG: glycosyltransferase [Myxococcales bacterium]|nr:glycosyltransferase [Myxococcales bacterium]